MASYYLTSPAAVVFVVVCLVVNTINTTRTSTQSSAEMEARALLGSGWWGGDFGNPVNTSASHCEWPCIICNDEGSVTEIKLNEHFQYVMGGGRKLRDLNFSSFPNLRVLGLSHNNFYGDRIGGKLPVSLAKLTQLEVLDISGNGIIGSIPSEIGNLTSLMQLSLSGNKLNGSIPSELGPLLNLTRLDLSGNRLSGSMPPELGHLLTLTQLDLSGNRISGSVPPELGQLLNLTRLDLSRNLISGSIPPELGHLLNLAYLDLSWNRLSGGIPAFGPFLSSRDIDGSHVHCLCLRSLDLRRNNMSGKFPANYSSFSNLRNLDLSHYHLSGTIPTFLCLLQYRPVHSYIDLYSNALEQCFPPCDQKTRNISTRTILLCIIGISFPILLLGVLLFTWRCKARKNQVGDNATNSGNILSIWNYDGKIAYEDIVRATNEFDIKYCIGTGGYGSVYKAQLPSGNVVALKKLHRLEAEEPAFDKSFKNEAQVLSSVRHKSIVKLYGFCLHNWCMFLVYEYMERGSLFCTLGYDAEAAELDWSKRVNIVKSIAHALSYLHHGCTPPLVYRDISSNNILLNSKLQAFVADFGAARFLDPDSSNQTVIAGTYGYIAPELAYTMWL